MEFIFSQRTPALSSWVFLEGSALWYVNAWYIIKDTYGSSVPLSAQSSLLFCNEQYYHDLLLQQMEIQDKDVTCLQEPISMG